MVFFILHFCRHYFHISNATYVPHTTKSDSIEIICCRCWKNYDYRSSTDCNVNRVINLMYSIVLVSAHCSKFKWNNQMNILTCATNSIIITDINK